MIKRLTITDLEYLGFKLAKKYLEKKGELIPEFYTCDKKKLDACLMQPYQTAFGQPCYRGFGAKAAVLFYGIIKNHPYQNGNKRIAVTTLVAFAWLHNKTFTLSKADMERVSLVVAKSHATTRGGILDLLAILFDSGTKDKKK